jgi:hypothetical protein
MRRDAANVKQLAPRHGLWHGRDMKKPKPVSKEDRLAEALRANLRRRKSGGAAPQRPIPSCPKPAD